MYPKEINAAVLIKHKTPLSIKKILFKKPLKRGQILVKIFYSGICGKQIDEINGIGEKDRFIPHCLGHEASAIVIKIGPGVKKVNPGHKVILHWIKGNGINSSLPEYYEKGSLKKINAGWVTTFNDYAVVSENRVTKLNRKINLKHAALFGCAVPTGVGTILNYKKFTKGNDFIGIVGCGGVGLLMIEALKIANKKNIIAIDIKENALKLAKKCGAKSVIRFQNNNNYLKKVLKLTNNQGFDHLFVNTGNTKAIVQSLKTLSKKGHFVQVGVPKFKMNAKINLFEILHGKNISGCMGGNTIPQKHMKVYLDLYKKKRLNLNKIISKTFLFKNINQAIKYHKKSSGRVLIKF